MYNENHFTKNPYEDNGRFQIHPLSSEGLEAYLSKDSYNYHYLKSRYDPELLKQIQEEMKQEKENKIQLKGGNLNCEENKINENQKIDKTNNNIQSNANNKGNNSNTKKTNEKKNVNINNKGKKNKVINKGTNNANKIGTMGHATNPVISNIKNDRGRLKDFQQPYHS